MGGARPSNVHLDVAWTADQVDERAVAGSTAVAIDVLRATTTMAALFEAGVAAVWPATEIDEARALAERLGDQALLAGERGGVPPSGFDMGNSPLEIRPEKVRGRHVVLTTTNGTRAIHRAAGAERLATAAFVNAAAVVEWLHKHTRERLYIICAGTQGKFSMDDALCAGMIAARFVEEHSESERIELSDAAAAAIGLYERYAGEIGERVAACRHGRNLAALEMEKDVSYAVQIDRCGVVPVRSLEEHATIVRGERQG